MARQLTRGRFLGRRTERPGVDGRVSDSTDRETQKKDAADAALAFVRPNTTVGLGSGSTVRYFIEALARRYADGLPVLCVATSTATAAIASRLRLPLVTEPALIDVAVDGADEIDPDLRLIKGHGGALTREKLTAIAARQFVVIADESKLVAQLGRGPVPVEVVPFLWRQTASRLGALGAEWGVRGGERSPTASDNGNYIVDLRFGQPIADPADLAAAIKRTVGVVEHGLFIGGVSACIVAGPSGVRTLS